ncbi:capsular biosynthesis protein [Sphingobium sp. DEHP117]|uniref:capsule biosynthesis protein n=1 Tax=Sphingobium sp. DEHP117 TaxID=2993436 RepID=UPI0027D5B59D|nr:capsular biosynthesis protein [Sphingobium sp. DEHP117]MDQ4420050.1 capsular biosynthesis protein [Sphingobium sp. DEHP117]
MKNVGIAKRRFLFLQGPQGPFFWLLAQEIGRLGYLVYRINLNGGDQLDWPGKAANYRGGQAGWNRYLDAFLRDNRITDILLFGDCRPLHQAAHGMAKLRGVNIHVFEEGYIRPHWMTMEPDGVNGHSSLPRDPEVLLKMAAQLPPPPRSPEITASFRRRMRDALRYYLAASLRRWQFPCFRSHRPDWPIAEVAGWALKYARQRLHRQREAEALAEVGKEPYFLFPLQLNSDYQIRAHSPFSSMYDAVLYVMESFARFAPDGTMLVIKEHPFDCQFRSWRRFLDRRARWLGIADRVLHVAGGDLTAMARDSLGMVTVNSTSGTLGLSEGVPVFVLGNAIYDIPGITHQGKLDDYWSAPQAPDPAVYDAFRRVLHARCLIPGGVASESAVATLIQSALHRLFEDPAHIPVRMEPGQSLAAVHAAAEVSTNMPASASAGTWRIR